MSHLQTADPSLLSLNWSGCWHGTCFQFHLRKTGKQRLPQWGHARMRRCLSAGIIRTTAEFLAKKEWEDANEKVGTLVCSHLKNWGLRFQPEHLTHSFTAAACGTDWWREFFSLRFSTDARIWDIIPFSHDNKAPPHPTPWTKWP